MAQQTMSVNDVLGGIDREIASVEAEYKAALTVAAEHMAGSMTAAMRAVKARAAAGADGPSAGSPSGVLVRDAPSDEAPELDTETAITLHKLETRLDQLKELRDWIKIDPQLAHFVSAIRDSRAPSSFRSPAPIQAASAGAGVSQEAYTSAAAGHRGIPAALAIIVALLALVGGWLLSLAVPAATLLPH